MRNEFSSERRSGSIAALQIVGDKGHTMRGFILVLVLGLAGCGEPFVLIPGASLSGTVAPAPESWNEIAKADTIQVEFDPADPYSINIWGVGIDRDLYIATGDSGTRWTARIAKDPRVRVRIDATVYELTATEVLEPTERGRVLDAYVRKYEEDRSDSFVADGMIFRLDRRS